MGLARFKGRRGSLLGSTRFPEGNVRHVRKGMVDAEGQDLQILMSKRYPHCSYTQFIISKPITGLNLAPGLFV
jgi:hypothetical protein